MAYLPSTPRRLVVDGHVHVYPAHRLERLADACLRGLTALAGTTPETQPAALLAESRGHAFFQQARRDGVEADGCSVAAGPDAETLWLRHPRHPQPLLMFAGRQIVTAERLEVLALTRDVDIADGFPLLKTLECVRDAGAIPCLAWSPGKWWGARGRLVRALLADRTQYLTVGDCALRPRFWREPYLMRQAALRGWPILAGSDPLPFPGDELRAGQYGFHVLLEAYDPNQPAAALRAALARGDAAIQRAGYRCAGYCWLRGRLKHHRYRSRRREEPVS